MAWIHARYAPMTRVTKTIPSPVGPLRLVAAAEGLEHFLLVWNRRVGFEEVS